MIPSLTPEIRFDIDRIFALQRDSALRLRNSTVEERLEKLERLRRAVLANRTSIVEAGVKDFRRAPIEVEFGEVVPIISDIAHTRRHLKKWLRPRKVRPTRMTLGTMAWVRYEPRGRCLIIAPWNYPVTLTLEPLVPAIASGNTVIIKTSEMAPAFSAVLTKIIRETFSEDEVAIVEGDVSVATALLDLPFDHIFFTGAPAIGKVVMNAAAKHLSSVTLELGGKSPTIVDASADLEAAVQTIAWGKYLNSGQTCIAPDHVFVHSSVMDRFVDLFKRRLIEVYGEGEAVRASQLGRVINERHAKRVAGLLNDAVEKGAKVLHGGLTDPADHFVEPTLLTNIPTGAQILEEEIFGPLLPIIPYDTLDEVIGRINAAPKPLALYIWSRDENTIERISANTSAGGTCINHAMVHCMHHNLPFGGVNHSGIGSYHGEWGIRAFSHERAFLRTRFLLEKSFFPPFGPSMQKVINLILRFA